MPRLVLVNLSKFDIHVAQLDADQAKHPPLLLPRQKAQALADDAAHGGIVWHWPDSRFRRRLRLRVAGGDAADGWGGGGWEWSAPFPIGDEAAAAIDVFMLKSRRKPSFADGAGGGASPGRRSDAHTNSLSSEYSGGAERSWGRLIAVEEERLQGVTYVKFDEGLKHEELFHFKNEMEHTVYYRQEVTALATHHSPLTTHHSPLTTHHSPLTTHRSGREPGGPDRARREHHVLVRQPVRLEAPRDLEHVVGRRGARGGGGERRPPRLLPRAVVGARR